ncbi:MAG: polymer-forming cytoskeletal protein [Candidatus Fermentibacteraceae bacterium]|nr:polymer-forming cytoskeletal protein [Candidatus Fermentibacteraceae bacterium]MBN2609630.1 polymer-forming cytoskeletal protein [Candidatus Fermentibacteraceae bacterium]
MSKNESAAKMDSILGSGSFCKGSVKVDGGLRVDGTVDGEVVVSGTLTVGREGVITGDVTVNQAVVGGKIQGTVRAEQQLELHSGSRVEGDIFTRSLVIEDGVFFEGSCKMSRGNDSES